MVQRSPSATSHESHSCRWCQIESLWDHFSKYRRQEEIGRYTWLPWAAIDLSETKEVHLEYLEVFFRPINGAAVHRDDGKRESETCLWCHQDKQQSISLSEVQNKDNEGVYAMHDKDHDANSHHAGHRVKCTLGSKNTCIIQYQL
jgi:hypothetical protein